MGSQGKDGEKAVHYHSYKLTVEVEGADRPCVWYATLATEHNIEGGMVPLLGSLHKMHVPAARTFQVVGIQSLKRAVPSDCSLIITQDGHIAANKGVYEHLGLTLVYEQATKAVTEQKGPHEAEG